MRDPRSHVAPLVSRIWSRASLVLFCRRLALLRLLISLCFLVFLDSIDGRSVCSLIRSDRIRGVFFFLIWIPTWDARYAWSWIA